MSCDEAVCAPGTPIALTKRKSFAYAAKGRYGRRDGAGMGELCALMAKICWKIS
jgi:hypothetical protein